MKKSAIGGAAGEIDKSLYNQTKLKYKIILVDNRQPLSFSTMDSLPIIGQYSFESISIGGARRVISTWLHRQPILSRSRKCQTRLVL